MNFFLKGDFKIGESWQKPSSRASKSRQKSKDKDKNSSLLLNAGKNIAQPSIDLIDDKLSQKLLKEFQAEIPPPSIRSEKKTPMKQANSSNKLPPKHKNMSNNDGDLLASMATRLKNVQTINKNQKLELKEKNQIIDKMRGQNIFLKGLRQDAPKQYEKMKNLAQQNEGLKHKVEEMQKYLKKYGFKWVGNKIQGKLQQDQLRKDIKKGNYNYRLPSEIDINTISRRVEQLNAGLHSQGQGTEVYQEKGIHKFRKAEPLPMGFFANGVAIKGFKFFPYKTKESLQILGDLVDGYFPYVLKHKYPNGVFIKVVDKLTQQYNQDTSQGAISTYDSIENKDFKPPSKQQFLSNLPKQVMKNGKVIQIRSQIEKRMKGENQIKQEKQEQQQENMFYEKEDGMIFFKTSSYQKIKNKEIVEEDVCTLKIRNHIGEILIAHLEKSASIRDIYYWMAKITPKKDFQIMSNFPRKTFQLHEPMNLQELGFYPNAMLHIHSQK